MEEMNDFAQPEFPGLVEQKESVKLIKNSRGYNWEIRVLQREGETMDDYMLRLSKIDDELNKRYGNLE